MVLPIIIGLIIAVLLMTAYKTSKFPRREWLYQAPVVLLELLSIYSAALLAIVWGYAWWQILLYLVGFIAIGLGAEWLADYWRRQLRLAGKISPPEGWSVVPRGKVLVQTREFDRMGDLQGHLVVGARGEGQLYRPESTLNPFQISTFRKQMSKQAKSTTA